MFNRISDYLPTTWNKGHKSQTAEARSQLEETNLASWSQSVEQFVRSHPGASLAAAFCVGVTVAWWIKRR